MRKRFLMIENGLRRFFLNGFGGSRQNKLGIVSCDKYEGRVLDDLLLQRYFLKHGVVTEVISWQDKTIDYSKFAGLIIGSMWGYQNYLKDFSNWLSKIDKANLVTVNPLIVIRKNYDKALQFESLKRAGLPVIDTTVVEVGKLSGFDDFKDDLVIKPSISGSGENTFLVRSKEQFNKIYNRLERINKERELLVQPFVSEIVDGELGIVMIGGKVINAVRRFPGILEGEYKVELVSLDKLPEEAAKLALAVSELSDYKQATYLRVDMVLTHDGYKLMEVEAFEPQLYYYLLDDEPREKMLGLMFDEVMRRINIEN